MTEREREQEAHIQLSKHWLCCLEDSNLPPRQGPGHQGRDVDGRMTIHGRKRRLVQGRSVEEGALPSGAPSTFSFTDHLDRRWGAPYGWYCLQRHLQVICGITSPRNHIFLRRRFPEFGLRMWAEDVRWAWVFRCDRSASVITVPGESRERSLS